MDLNNIHLFGSGGHFKGAVNRILSPVDDLDEFYNAALPTPLDLFLK